MNAKNLFIITVIISLLAVGIASAQTVGDLQNEVRDIDFGRDDEGLLQKEIAAKISEVSLLENEIFSLVKMKMPSEQMVMDAQGKISGAAIIGIGGFSGDYKASSRARTDKLYEDWRPTLSEKTSGEVLSRLDKFLNQNGSYSLGEAKLVQQVNEIKNERSENKDNKTGIHVMELAEVHNTLIDIRSELKMAYGDVDQKYAERFSPYVAIALLAIVIGFIIWMRRHP